MQFVYKCLLLKIIGNCNNSNPHRGPVLDPHSKQLSLSLSLSLPPPSLPVQPPTTSQRCTVNCSECAPICSAMSLWKSANSTIACCKLNSVYLPIIQVSAADFVSTLLTFILHQCTCTYHFVSTFILHQCTCTYHFVSTLLTFILHQCTCAYHFVSTLLTFILDQCTCTYHFVTSSSKFTVLLASCVFFFYHHYKKIMHISKI